MAALVDDVLLVLECKNSILPCNLFELRTSYQHCETAAGQLDRVMGLLDDPAHRETVLTRLGAARRPVTQVVSGIAVSNRLFAGLRIGRHLVISLGQFARFITHGDFYLAGQLARTRGEGSLSGAALAEFMAGGFFRRMFAAMKPAARTYNCGGRNLRFNTFFLDFLELGRQFGIDINPEEFEHDASDQS